MKFVINNNLKPKYQVGDVIKASDEFGFEYYYMIFETFDSSHHVLYGLVFLNSCFKGTITIGDKYWGSISDLQESIESIIKVLKKNYKHILKVDTVLEVSE